MLSYGHNGAISMDATFGTNDMKFHLFTLMGFNDHRTGPFNLDHYKQANN